MSYMKRIFLIALLFVITGCTVNYDLNIDSDYIDEKVNINLLDDDFSDSAEVEEQLNYKKRVYNDNNFYYNSKVLATADGYEVTYSYKHDVNNYGQSSFVEKCYGQKTITTTDDLIKINTNPVFYCLIMEDGFYADAVDINITTQLKVQDHNADEVIGNTYKWHIDESNYQNKPINMVLKKDKTAQEIAQNIVDKIPNKEIIYVCLFILLSAIIIYIYVKHKQKIKNEI